MVPTDFLSLDPEALARSEERLRQKLSAGVPRRPSAQPTRQGRTRASGDVPVVMVNQRRSASVILPAAEEQAAPAHAEALRHERETREQAEQALRQAHQTIRQLQAQLAHAEIAHSENLAAEQQARERAEEAAREAHATVDRLTQAASPRRARRRAETPSAAAGAQADGQGAGAPDASGSDTDEPTDNGSDAAAPVEWWRPGWRNQRS